MVLEVELKQIVHSIATPVAPGEARRIARFGIKVAPFDRETIVAGLRMLGTEILPAPEESGLNRFRDNYGVSLEIVAA